jgi:hypothetical protein
MVTLKELKTKLESLNELQQLDVVQILLKQKISFSENSNGIFLNLTNLQQEELLELEKYIKYIYDQEEHLSEIENVKKEYKKNYFDNSNQSNEQTEQEQSLPA